MRLKERSTKPARGKRCGRTRREMTPNSKRTRHGVAGTGARRPVLKVITQSCRCGQNVERLFSPSASALLNRQSQQPYHVPCRRPLSFLLSRKEESRPSRPRHPCDDLIRRVCFRRTSAGRTCKRFLDIPSSFPETKIGNYRHQRYFRDSEKSRGNEGTKQVNRFSNNRICDRDRKRCSC